MVVCVKCAFGVPSGSSTLDPHHHDQGRTQLRPEPVRGVETVVDPGSARGYGGSSDCGSGGARGYELPGCGPGGGSWTRAPDRGSGAARGGAHPRLRIRWRADSGGSCGHTPSTADPVGMVASRRGFAPLLGALNRLFPVHGPRPLCQPPVPSPICAIHPTRRDRINHSADSTRVWASRRGSARQIRRIRHHDPGQLLAAVLGEVDGGRCRAEAVMSQCEEVGMDGTRGARRRAIHQRPVTEDRARVHHAACEHLAVRRVVFEPSCRSR